MPIEIRCDSCGFIFYRGSQLRSVEDILRGWGMRCPICLSPVSKSPLAFRVRDHARPETSSNSP